MIVFEIDRPTDPFRDKDFQKKFRALTGVNFFLFVKNAGVRLHHKKKIIENNQLKVTVYPMAVKVEKL